MVLKITPELIEESVARTPGLTKSRLESLYRTDWLSLKRLAPLLSSEYGTEVTLKHLAALMEHHDISKWTPAEQRIAAKHRPANEDNIAAKAEELAALGYDKTKLEELYHGQNLSKNEIIELINNGAGSEVVHKTWLKKTFEHYGIEKKGKAAQYARREEVSLKTNMERYGTRNAMQNDEVKARSRKALQANGGFTLQRPELRAKAIKALKNKKALEPSSYELLTKELEARGCSKEVIESTYFKQNFNSPELAVWLTNKSGLQVTEKQTRRLITHLGIVKPQELIALKQGEVSRAITDANLEKLKSLGYTPKTLSQYYDKNKRLTYEDVRQKLNENLSSDYEPFDTRWLEKQICKHLPADRLRGVSRAELAFGEDLRTIYKGKVQHGNRKLIAPYHVDYYLPELNLAIEFNGERWHSDEILTRQNHGLNAEQYHTMKKFMCQGLGIRLLFVWHDDWRNKHEEVMAAVARELAGDTSDSKLLTILTKG